MLLLAPARLSSRWVENEPALEILSGAIALLYLHHLQGLARNVRLNFWGNQADLTRAGKLLSLVAIPTVLMLVTDWALRTPWP